MFHRKPTSILKQQAGHAAIVLLLGNLAIAQAGDLNPPVGGIGPTFKTLTEVEPRVAINGTNTPGNAASTYRIAQPGSYYLTSNLSGVSGKMVILVAAPDVTIDLMGFSIAGGTSAIGRQQLVPSVTVRNGHISNCLDVAINLGGCDGSTIENVSVRDCELHGVFIGGHAIVRNVQVQNCGGYGIQTGGNGMVLNCSVMSSGAAPTAAYQSLACSRFIDCIAINNYGYGFFANGEACVFSGCVSRYSGNDGFYLHEGCRIERCLASNNQGEGIRAQGNSTILDCTSNYNGLRGIRAGNACTVHGCQTRANGMRGNFAGIWLEGSGSRADGNEMTDNDFGLYTRADHNVIVKNSARNNPMGDFFVGPGNELAPVVTNPGSNGFAGMNAWSNIAY